MDTLRQFRKTAVEFLALPLIVLSAALCVIEGLTTLKTVDFGVLPAAVFAVVCCRKRLPWLALTGLLTYAVLALIHLMTLALAAFCGRHPSLFGAVNTLYTLCAGNGLTQVVLHTDCTGAVVTAQGIVTGAADCYNFGTAGAAEAASRWLDGAFFACVFLPLGGAAFLWQSANKKEKAMLVVVTALSVLTGDCRLFALAVLLLYPAGLVMYLLMSALAYLAAALLQSGIGYRYNPSVFELVHNGNHQSVIFVLCGFVLALMYYFVLRYTNIKWRKSDEPA